MKVYLEIGGARRDTVEAPRADAGHVVVAGECPDCKASPFKVAGVAGSMTHDHDTYRADARCIACDKGFGKLVVEVSTIFGIEEDRAVLVHGRARVY